MFFILYNEPTNTQSIDKLLYCSYMFLHYCVIWRVLGVSKLLSYLCLSQDMLLWECTYVLWACLRVILSADSADRRLQHIICRCKAIARWQFNVFGDTVVEPKVIRAVTVRNLCLFIGGIRLLRHKDADADSDSESNILVFVPRGWIKHRNSN
jgi:hypothetical protein